MTQPPAPREIPAGWYPDPEGKPATRYWDGDSWTDQVGPMLPAPPVTSAFAPVAVDMMGMPVSSSSRLVAAVLCFFVGVLGIHRFYVGKVGTGVVQLLTVGGLGIWTWSTSSSSSSAPSATSRAASSSTGSGVRPAVRLSPPRVQALCTRADAEAAADSRLAGRRSLRPVVHEGCPRRPPIRRVLSTEGSLGSRPTLRP